MSKIKCIIIEDEPLAAKILTDYILRVPFLELQASLIFLDIHLPELKGMAFLRTLTNPPSIIVTTAYHQYAVEGFELNVADYLLKPFEFERFLTAVNKVAQKEHQKLNESEEFKDYIFLNVQKKKVKILFSEIVFIESQREYIKIKTTQNEYLTKMSTKEIEDILPADRFKRIHRSFIISIARIEKYTSDTVELAGVSIPIGRGYRDVIEHLY
jgi:DNA-binding LytR/AlgR family response regulator